MPLPRFENRVQWEAYVEQQLRHLTNETNRLWRRMAETGDRNDSGEAFGGGPDGTTVPPGTIAEACIPMYAEGIVELAAEPETAKYTVALSGILPSGSDCATRMNGSWTLDYLSKTVETGGCYRYTYRHLTQVAAVPDTFTDGWRRQLDMTWYPERSGQTKRLYIYCIYTVLGWNGLNSDKAIVSRDLVGGGTTWTTSTDRHCDLATTPAITLTVSKV